jgi:predicted nucleic acid-binding Zn ribbon protein
MKPIAFLTIVLLALPAFAQDKPAPAPEAAKPEATKSEAVKEAAKPAPTKSAASRKAGRRWNEDARHCLEKASNTEVIKCAEEYL